LDGPYSATTRLFWQLPAKIKWTATFCVDKYQKRHSTIPKLQSVIALRNSTRQVIENAHFRGRRYLVERAGQPMVVVLGIEEYERLSQQKPMVGDVIFTSPARAS
jgi:prevent-host-death family protein